MTRADVGHGIRRARIAYGLTVTDVAGMCGVTRYQFVLFETGAVIPERLHGAIAEAVGVSMGELFEEGRR